MNKWDIFSYNKLEDHRTKGDSKKTEMYFPENVRKMMICSSL